MKRAILIVYCCVYLSWFSISTLIASGFGLQETPAETPVPVITPTPIVSESPTQAPIVNEIFLAQGAGGENIVRVKNFDRVSPHSINSSFHIKQVMLQPWLERIGGGSGRPTYFSIGDFDDNGSFEYVFTFGPVVGNATYPNIVSPIDRNLWRSIRSPFSAFPTGTGHPARYNGGELRTAIGDFMEDGKSLLAVAQGSGSQFGLVRLFEFTGRRAPDAWVVKAQFQPLDDVPNMNNANGGVTLVSGDVDGDGLDELLAGQTNSETSLTQFTVIDVDETGLNLVRHNFAAFPPGFRGQGGAELLVTDLNGDGINEIIAASKGKKEGEEGSLISVIVPVIENNHITGFVRPNNSVFQVFSEDVNPGGGLFIGSGELDSDDRNGNEIIIGSGDGAPEACYRVVKIHFDSNSMTNGSVNRITQLGSSDHFPFNENNPSSGAVFVGSAEIVRWHYPLAPGE